MGGRDEGKGVAQADARGRLAARSPVRGPPMGRSEPSSCAAECEGRCKGGWRKALRRRSLPSGLGDEIGSAMTAAVASKAQVALAGNGPSRAECSRLALGERPPLALLLPLARAISLLDFNCGLSKPCPARKSKRGLRSSREQAEAPRCDSAGLVTAHGGRVSGPASALAPDPCPAAAAAATCRQRPSPGTRLLLIRCARITALVPCNRNHIEGVVVRRGGGCHGGRQWGRRQPRAAGGPQR